MLLATRSSATTSDDADAADLPGIGSKLRSEGLDWSKQQKVLPGLFATLLFSVCLIAWGGITMTAVVPQEAVAAPPVAVIAEELGYFPVRNRDGNIVYVPARIQRQSTDQDIRLARRLKEAGATMFGTYWCPHTSRQKALFGREAWESIPYVECAPAGWQGQPSVCISKRVDGYPTWVFPKTGTRLSGERQLQDLAEQVGFSGFRPELETDLPPPLGSGACNKS